MNILLLASINKTFLFYSLLALVPVAALLNYVEAGTFAVFVVSVLALVPLAKLIGDSTENLGSHYGATLGSLLNVTFGNAAEIIISISALSAGLFTFVKATITGSILGNILLIFGLSIFAGGLRHKEQTFNKENIGNQSSLLFLAIIALSVPTILAVTTSVNAPTSQEGPENNYGIQTISDILAIILLIVYLASILFTFHTHRYLFVSSAKKLEGGHNESKKENSRQDSAFWSKKKSFLILSISIVGVSIISEILVGSIESVAEEFNIGHVFLGAVIVGLVGNAAEHSSAILLSIRDKLDMSIGIAAGSGTQVALFVVPVLVISGMLIGKPFSLVFTLFEVIALFLAAVILNWIVHDGKSNWFEGVMLIAVFAIFAVGFFFVR